MILLAYFMLAFCGIVQGHSNGNTLAEVLSFIIVVAIVISNFLVLFKKTWDIMMLNTKRKLAIRAHRKKKHLNAIGKNFKLKLNLNKIGIEPSK